MFAALRPGDLLITMGAGDVETASQRLLDPRNTPCAARPACAQANARVPGTNRRVQPAPQPRVVSERHLPVLLSRQAFEHLKVVRIVELSVVLLDDEVGQACVKVEAGHRANRRVGVVRRH